MKRENKNKGLPAALANLVKEHTKQPALIEIGEGGEKFTITIYPMVSATARAGAILNAAQLVFNEFDKTVEGYMPAFLELAGRYGVVLCYTDFNAGEELELEQAWAVLMYTPIYEKIAGHVGEDEIAEFRKQLKEMIDARLQERIHMVNFDRIVDRLGGLFDRFGEQFKDIDVEKTLKQFEGLPKKLGGLKGFGLENIIKTFIDSGGKLQTEDPQ